MRAWLHGSSAKSRDFQKGGMGLASPLIEKPQIRVFLNQRLLMICRWQRK